MIHLCACGGGSSDTLESQQGSKACKYCGGDLAVDGLGALAGNMLSSEGLDLIDPQLNWKTAPKGKQRAVRKARTSFPALNKKRVSAKNSKEITDVAEKEFPRMGDIPVSESEKVGVSILGRRFSGCIENVPIKKRKFLLVRSPSPPPQTPDAKDSDLLFKCDDVIYEESLKSKRTNIRGTTEEVCDNVDFSGISILAAAACNSDIGVDFINAEAFVSQGQSHKAVPLLEFFEGIESNSIGEELMGRCNNSPKSFPTSEAQMEKTDERKLSGSESKNLSDHSQNDSEKIQSSRDSRLHWDLNTVMDAWEGCDDVNSKPSVTGLAVENGDDYKKFAASPSTQIQPDNIMRLPELDATKGHSAGITETDVCKLDTDELKSAGICNGTIIPDSKRELHAGKKNEPKAEVTSTPHRGSCVESKSENDDEYDIHIPSIDASHASNCPPLNEIEEKVTIDSDSGLMMEAELVCSRVPSAEDASCANVDKADFICTNPRREEVLVDCSKDLKEETERNCGDCCLDDAAAKQTDLSNFQSEKEENITADVHERAFTMVSDINTCRNAAHSLSSSFINKIISDELGACNGDSDDKTFRDMDASLSNVQQGNNEKSFNHMEPILGGECADDQNDAEQKTIETQCTNFIDATLTCYNNDDDCGQKSSEDSLPISAGSASLKPDTNSLRHVACIEEPGKKVTDACQDSSKDVARDAQLKNDPVQYATHIDDDQANGMEKLDLVGDDDSQYEDGEFRESILYSWGEEVAEETEQLDYGSDNRENDTFEPVSGSSSFPVDSWTSRVGDLALPGSDGLHALKDRQTAGLITLSKCSSTSQDCDAVSWRRNSGSVDIEGHKDNFAVNESREGVDASLCGISDKLTGYMVFQRSDYNKEPSASSRLKMSGWDQLPEVRRCYRDDNHSDAGFDSIKHDRNAFDISASESLRSKSAWRRDLSRVDRSKPLDESCRNDRSYMRPIRHDDHRGPSPKAQREAITSGRGGSSHYGQGRGRTDCWFDSSNHSHARHHDSPGYYGAPSFSQSNARNAAAAAVAKVESNGFVVAPDGTLVKAAGTGADNHLPRRSGNASTLNQRGSLSGRGSSTERDRQCGVPRALGHSREFSPRRHFSVGRGQAGRYGNDIVREQYRRNVLNGPMDISPATHQLPRRDRSISPHRAPLNLSRSRTRSQSRSRTRSPPRWTSPRGRFDATANSVRRRSRSPNFKTESRMVRMRSPRQRPNFQDDIGGYGPTSRIQASPPHASRWADDRDDSSDRLREHEYKRSSRRSPNIRGIRNNRFDPEDSQGRLKHDDYFRNLRPSRVSEYNTGFDRRFKHDGDGRGRRVERFELLHSAKHFDTNNKIKRLHYDVDSSFHTSPGVKSAGFQRRGSPSGFDRGIPRQLGDSPGRDHVAKIHY